MHIIRERFYKIAMHTGVSYNLFIELIKYTLANASSFVLLGKVYRQLFGLAMGGILSAVISDIVPDYFLEKIIPSHDIDFFNKFMDDILCVMPREKVKAFHLALNGIHPRLQFTSELDSGNGVNYLDMKMFIVRNKVVTSWYQKDICSGRLLSYLSNHSRATKVNLVTQFVKKAMSLTDAPFADGIMEKVKDILRVNNLLAKPT